MRFFIALIAALVMGTAATAGEQIYKCEMKAYSRSGWVPPVLFVWLEDGSYQAEVYDGLIKDIVGKPLSARITHRDDKSAQFTWVLNDIPLSNRRLRVTAEYKAKLMLKTGRISIAAHIGGDMDPPRGGGTCKPFDPKKKKK